MIISCSECSTRYVVAPRAIGPAGRRVKCSKCGHVWFEEPPAEDLEIVPEKVVKAAAEPENNPEKEAGGPKEKDETEAQREKPENDEQKDEKKEDPLGIFGDDFKTNVPAVVEDHSVAVRLGWFVLFLLLIGGAVALYQFRGWFEDKSQVAETLYEKWDYAVLGVKPPPAKTPPPIEVTQPHPSSYLTIRQSAEVRVVEDSPSLVVAVEVSSQAPFEINLPPMEGVLRNAEGGELFTWTQMIDPSVVPANGVLQFQVIVDNVPAETAQAELVFDWPEGP